MEGYQLEIVIYDMFQVGKLYKVNPRVMSVPIYDRVPMYYPTIDENYSSLEYLERHIDWYDPDEPKWGYRFSRHSLDPYDIFMIVGLHMHVTHAWSITPRPQHIGVQILKGDIIGWLYQPADGHGFTLISP